MCLWLSGTAWAQTPDPPTLGDGTTPAYCANAVETPLLASCPVATTLTLVSSTTTLFGVDLFGDGQQRIYPPLDIVGVTAYTVICTNSSGLSSQESLTLTVTAAPDSPTVTSSLADLTVTAGATFSLTASCPTGSTPVWDDDDQAPIIRTITAPDNSGIVYYGAYCSPNDGSDCRSESSFIEIEVITPPVSPTITPGTDLSACIGTAVSVTASCPNNFGPLFILGDGTSLFGNQYTVDGTIAGVFNYTVTCLVPARVANGANLVINTVTGSITIQELPTAPIVSASPASATAVAGASVTLTASCPTGSVEWNTGSTDANIVTPTTAGTYSYTATCVTTGGCRSTGTPVSATVINPPGAPSVNSLTVCQNAVGALLEASCPSGGTAQFSLNGGNVPAPLSLTTSTAGIFTYTAYCVSDNGIVSAGTTATVVVRALPAAPIISSSSGSFTATTNQSLTLTTNCASTVWVAYDNTLIVAPSVVVPSVVGVYSYSARCTDGGCTGPETVVSVTVSPVVSEFPTVDLSLPKVDVSRRTPAPGERVRYVTHVLNEDINTSTNIRIAVQMPVGFNYSTDNSPTTDPSSTTWAITPTSPGTTYDAGQNRVFMTLPSLAPGQRVLLYFYGTVPPIPTISTASDANKYYAYWEIISADNPDPDSPHGNGFCNGEDDTQSIDTRVNIPTDAGADVELFGNMSVSNTTPAQNEIVTIQVGIKNNLGPQVATNVVTKATLPTGLSYINSSTPGVSYNAETRELTFTANSIAVNATRSFVFTASVTAPENTNLRMQAEIKSSDQFDHDSVYGNIICNNYDDDTDEIRMTVRGVLTPPVEPPVNPGGTLTILTPLYDCATGQITFRTSGGSGSPITFTAIGVQRSSPTSTTGIVEAGVRADQSIITIGATQDGQSAQPLSFNFRQFCAQNPNPSTPPSTTTTEPPSGTTVTPGSLTLLAPLYNCETRQVTFQTAGGSGSPMLYSIVFVTVPSANPVQFIDAPVVNDQNNSTVILRVQQDGVVLNRVFNFREFCSGTPPVNQAPVGQELPPQSATVGTAFSYTVPPLTDPNGDALTYTATGLPANGLSFDPATRVVSGVPTQTGVIGAVITATDPGGLSGQSFVTITISGTASGPVSPTQPGGSLALVAPTYNCGTGAFTFNVTGGNGQPIEFRAVGITDWATTAGPYTVQPFADAQPFVLQARYVGQLASEVSYIWDFRAACNAGRLAREVNSQLSVTVLGNPTTDEFVQVTVRGAAGQPLRLAVTDASGVAVGQLIIERADAVETRRVQLGRSAGIYLLQMSTPTERTTVKVVRQ